MVAKRSVVGAPSSADMALRPTGSALVAGLRGATHANTHIKVEDSQLPLPPSATSSPLPPPAGGHEWVALQAAVNDAVEQFSGPSAKMGWKKWALTQHHSSEHTPTDPANQ